MEKLGGFIDSIDLVMCDLKIFDEEAHLAHTGIRNRTVKENIRKLNGMGKRFIVRTPLIPQATDSNENIKAIGEFLGELEKLERWELLNFNPLGASKYSSLGIENPYAKTMPLTPSRCEELCSIARSYVKEVKIV